MNISWRRALVTIGGISLLTLAGCGGNGGPGNGPGDGPLPSGDVVTGYTATEESEPETFLLAQGRYRITWRHTCEEIGVLLALADGTAEFEQTSTSRAFTVIRTNVPGGEYQIQQTNADCTDWEIRIDRM